MHTHRQAPAVIPPPRSVVSAIPGSEPGQTAAAPRPLRRAFRGETSQVPLVRDFIRRCLHGWPCPVVAVEDIVLCATELAANAVRHSRSGLPGGRFAVQVFLCPGEWVEVTVEDAGGPWASRDTGDGPEYGRGLQIVSVLAAETGIVTETVAGRSGSAAHGIRTRTASSAQVISFRRDRKLPGDLQESVGEPGVRRLGAPFTRRTGRVHRRKGLA